MVGLRAAARRAVAPGVLVAREQERAEVVLAALAALLVLLVAGPEARPCLPLITWMMIDQAGRVWSMCS